MELNPRRCRKSFQAQDAANRIHHTFGSLSAATPPSCAMARGCGSAETGSGKANAGPKLATTAAGAGCVESVYRLMAGKKTSGARAVSAEGGEAKEREAHLQEGPRKPRLARRH